MTKHLQSCFSLALIKFGLFTILFLVLFSGCKRDNEFEISHSYICYPDIAHGPCAEIDGSKFRIIQEINSLESDAAELSNTDSSMREMRHGSRHVLKIVGENGTIHEYLMRDSMLVNIQTKIVIPGEMMCYMDSLRIRAELENINMTRQSDSLDNESIQRILRVDYAEIPQICEISNKLQQLKERGNDSLYKKILFEIWVAPGQVYAGDHWSRSYRLDMLPRLIFLKNGKTSDYLTHNGRFYHLPDDCSIVDSLLKHDIENAFGIKITDPPNTVCAKEHLEKLPHLQTPSLDPIRCGE